MAPYMDGGAAGTGEPVSARLTTTSVPAAMAVPMSAAMTATRSASQAIIFSTCRRVAPASRSSANSPDRSAVAMTRYWPRR